MNKIYTDFIFIIVFICECRHPYDSNYVEVKGQILEFSINISVISKILEVSCNFLSVYLYNILSFWCLWWG